MQKILLLTTSIVAWIAAGPVLASDQIPGKLPSSPIAITGGTIYPVNAPRIENGTLVFDQGLITAVGTDIDIPENAQVFKADGMHVYPGLFEPYSRIGLVEINAVRASNDFNETGRLNPNVLANVSVNPDSEIIPVTRSNGVLLNMTVPAGGLISGQSAIIRLDGWTTEEMTLKSKAAMVVSMHNDEDADSLHNFLDDARRYQKSVEANETTRHDIRLASVRSVLSGDQPIIVHADSWLDINRAIAFSQNEGLKLIIMGGYDAPKCADLLLKYDIPIILSSVHRKPLYRHDAFDAAYTLPSQLQGLGLRYCISGFDRSSSYNVRNLPYHAATAVAYGLSEEQALKAITLSPAEILGVDSQVGSLTAGKEATLFISSGTPLETTSHVQKAWIAGRPVDLGDKQKMLYRKYQQKYSNEGK